MPSGTALKANLREFWSGSGTEEVLGKAVMMPSGDPDPGVDYWMPH
jgi:hypothetical protein